MNTADVLATAARATALATAVLGPGGPDRTLVATLLAELDEPDRSEVVTLAIVSAALEGAIRQGIALDVAWSRTTPL